MTVQDPSLHEALTRGRTLPAEWYTDPELFEREEERIFERSYRGAAAEHAAPGTGLGLYVARKIVRAHGGNLDLCRNRAASGTA